MGFLQSAVEGSSPWRDVQSGWEGRVQVKTMACMEFSWESRDYLPAKLISVQPNNPGAGTHLDQILKVPWQSLEDEAG